MLLWLWLRLHWHCARARYFLWRRNTNPASVELDQAVWCLDQLERLCRERGW